MESVYGVKYRYGSAFNTLAPVSGVSTDWAYGVHKTPLSFVYEFREGPGDARGDIWILPPEEIVPNSEETLVSIMALIRKAKELGYFQTPVVPSS